jgi:hypothetical protein
MCDAGDASAPLGCVIGELNGGILPTGHGILP